VEISRYVLLESLMISYLLKYLEQRINVVILDAPPVLLVTDAVVVGAKTQGIIFVAAAGITKKRALEAAVTSLETARVPLRGIIATMLPTKGPSFTGYGAYAYVYGDDARRPARKYLLTNLKLRTKTKATRRR